MEEDKATARVPVQANTRLQEVRLRATAVKVKVDMEEAQEADTVLVVLDQEASEGLISNRVPLRAQILSALRNATYMRILLISTSLRRLWQWFSSVDEDGSGAITAKELQKCLINGDWTRMCDELLHAADMLIQSNAQHSSWTLSSFL